jgi:hypothetical protein
MKAYQILAGRFPWWPNLKNLTTAEVMECVVHKKARLVAEESVNL